MRNLARGEAYTAGAPTLRDTTFRTAVAQAALEDRERPGAYHRPAFHRPDGDPLVLDTARAVLTAVRRAKSAARLWMRAEVAGLVMTGPPASPARFALVADDVRAAGRAGSVELGPPYGDALGVEVRFGRRPSRHPLRPHPYGRGRGGRGPT